jgi:uncharacterized membrane protein YhaH (DUF805 family)
MQPVSQHSTISEQRPLMFIITFLLVFLYTYTAVGKLIEINKNEAVLSHLPLIGNYAFIIVWLIPVAELLIVALLLFHRTHATGFYLSVCLLSVFTLYLVYMLLTAERLPCTCGGVLEKMTWKQHVLFNLCFITLNLIALKIKNRKPSTLPSVDYDP